MRASIIVPTYNRPECLSRQLECIARQDGDFIEEVIICDDGSTTDTRSIIAPFRERVPRLEYLWQPNFGFRAGSARNLGIKQASGDVLIFVDDDVLFASDFVAHHVNSHAAGRRLGAPPRIVIGLRYRTFELPQRYPVPCEAIRTNDCDDRLPHIGAYSGPMHDHSHPWFFVYSCNLSLCRDENVWFDEDFVGWGMEDIELGYRLHGRGYQVFVHPDAQVLHIEDKAPHDPFRCEERGLPRKYNSYVRNAVILLEKHPNDPQLEAIIRNDIRWYVRNEHTGDWEKNGHENDSESVIEAVRAERRKATQKPVNGHQPRTSAIELVQQSSEHNIRLGGETQTAKDDDPLHWSLDEIAIELTTSCNLKCAMCSVWEGKKSGVDHELARELLATARKLGATSFVPCGAESFMRKDFVDLLAYTDALGFERQEVVTNGILVPHYLDELAQIPSVRLHISIDGPESIHDPLRGEGNYQKALTAARLAVERGISVGLSGVLMRPTMGTVQHIVDLAVELGVTEVSYQPFQQEIHGFDRDGSPWLFKREERGYVSDALAALQAYAAERGIKIFTDAIFGVIVPYLFDGVRPIPPGGCYMPSRFALVDVHGDLYPCFFMRDRSIGNVMRGERLEDLWHNHIHTDLQKLAITSRCPGCLAACSDIAGYERPARAASAVGSVRRGIAS